MVFSLIGFMGCGKSTIGRKLSEETGWPFYDLDSIIAEGESAGIPAIFERCGEAHFRELEYSYLKRFLDIHRQDNIILSLGGGTVISDKCRELTVRNTFPIYLKCPTDELVENLMIDGVENRPMFKGHDDIRSRVMELMGEREKIYEGCARITVHPYSLTAEMLMNEAGLR